jgi:hypothetical protein
MRYRSPKVRWRLARYRALLGFYLVAMAQFLSPAAAADPASKIDPPAWSHTHSEQELQSFGMRSRSQEPEKKQRISRALRRKRLADHESAQAIPPDPTIAQRRPSRNS